MLCEQNSTLWEQNSMLWEQNSMLWEQNSMLWEQDIILREQNKFFSRMVLINHRRNLNILFFLLLVFYFPFLVLSIWIEGPVAQ